MLKMIARDVYLTLAQAACVVLLVMGAWIARILFPGSLILCLAILSEIFDPISPDFNLTMTTWSLFILLTVLGAAFCGTRALLRLLRLFQHRKRHSFSPAGKHLLRLCLPTALLTSGLILTGNVMLDEWFSNNPWLYALAIAADGQYILDLCFYRKLLKRGENHDPC